MIKITFIIAKRLEPVEQTGYEKTLPIGRRERAPTAI
jgi:hypothetical protein